MTYPPGAQPGYRRTPLSAAEKARGEANFAPFRRPDARRQRTVQGERRLAGSGGAVPGGRPQGE
jgi:hypothetical protein